MTTRTIIFGLFAFATTGCADSVDSQNQDDATTINGTDSEASLGSFVNDGDEGTPDADADEDDGETDDFANDEEPVEGAGDDEADVEGTDDGETALGDDYPEITEDDVPRMTQELMQDVLDAGCTVNGVVMGEWDESSEVVEGKILSSDWNSTATFSARLETDESGTSWTGGWTEIEDDSIPAGSEPETGALDGLYDSADETFEGTLWEGDTAASEVVGYWVRQSETTGFMFGVGSICD